MCCRHRLTQTEPRSKSELKKTKLSICLINKLSRTVKEQVKCARWLAFQGPWFLWRMDELWFWAGVQRQGSQIRNAPDTRVRLMAAWFLTCADWRDLFVFSIFFILFFKFRLCTCSWQNYFICLWLQQKTPQQRLTTISAQNKMIEDEEDVCWNDLPVIFTCSLLIWGFGNHGERKCNNNNLDCCERCDET